MSKTISHPFPRKPFHSHPLRISYARILNLLTLLPWSKIQIHHLSIHLLSHSTKTQNSFPWLMQGKQIQSLNWVSLKGWSFLSLVHFRLVLGDKYIVNLRKNSSQQAENDVYPSSLNNKNLKQVRKSSFTSQKNPEKAWFLLKTQNSRLLFLNNTAVRFWGLNYLVLFEV